MALRAPLRAGAELAHNLVAGLKLALFLPIRRWQFRASPLQFILLLALALGISLGRDLVPLWPDAELHLPGLMFEAAGYCLFLLSIGVICAVPGRAERALTLALVLLSITPAGFVLYLLLSEAAAAQTLIDLARAHQAVLAIYIGWYLAAVARALGLVLTPGLLRGAAMLLFYAACNVLPWFLLPGAPLWRATLPQSAAPAAEQEADVENLLLSQAALLDAQVAALRPQRPGVIDVYFIGVAGDAGEGVFLNEARHARRVFAERFDTRGRSLLLANSARTQDTLPIAAVRTVSDAIARVAAVMDPREDLLVLYLTSHGAEDGAFQLDLDFWWLQPLLPEALRAALDDAGVDWRAVIVSACHSGAFVEPLRDPRTLVISSARADRKSFGCGHDGDYTYFGEALLGQELARAESLPIAFQRARARIDARERDEGHEPSEPQMALGSELAARLELLDAELASRRRTPSPPAAIEIRAPSAGSAAAAGD